ncbi:hypothetical protein MXB_508 [Myxobolus squamalis]|nr:hypothetical protein MXB_508 [Myxobolus squamalis]
MVKLGFQLTGVAFAKPPKKHFKPYLYYITNILQPNNGDRIIWGNTHSSTGFYRTNRNHRTPFKRHPHSIHTSLFSHILNRCVKLSMGTSALRNVDTFGGIDQYLLQTHPGKLKSAIGIALKTYLSKSLENLGYSSKTYDKFFDTHVAQTRVN